MVVQQGITTLEGTVARIDEYTARMYNSAIREHEAERCCTEDDPCSMRARVQAQLASGLPAAAEHTARYEQAMFEVDSPLHMPTNTRLMSENQRTAIINMSARKQVDSELRARIDKLVEHGGTFGEAGRVIAALRDAPWARENTQPVTEEGMYRTPNGEIYKVVRAVHGSGRLYAKKMVKLAEPRPYRNGFRSFDFVTQPGMLRRLSSGMRMTLEEAKTWGQIYGACCVCGAVLTDETSIELGIGPKCGNRI
jgi:hypothetical protein